MHAFVGRHLALADQVARAQKVLQLTIPGVPDIYQGTESPSPRLVDPDSRRGADWAGLHASLDVEGSPSSTFGIDSKCSL